MFKESELYHKINAYIMYIIFSPCSKPSSDDYGIRYVPIVFSLVVYFVFDLFYIAAIINYALQCQLITYLINVTIKRIHNSCYEVDQAIKVAWLL